MFDEAHYAMGPGYNASLKDGAVLFRLASLAHCDPSVVLSGEGSSRCCHAGRYNEPQQRASYCANNVLVCISEVLYHMYRTLLDRIRSKAPPEEIRSAACAKRVLVMFRVCEIGQLVHIDTDDIRADYDGRITGTTVVFPDAQYEPLRDVNKRFREEQKRGVVYPSARHSRDICVVLFRDESASIMPDAFIAMPMELRLIPEQQDIHNAPAAFDPFRDKVHPTMGFYKFIDAKALKRADAKGMINPKGLPAMGAVDFVRRKYGNYPKDAVCF